MTVQAASSATLRHDACWVPVAVVSVTVQAMHGPTRATPEPWLGSRQLPSAAIVVLSDAAWVTIPVIMPVRAGTGLAWSQARTGATTAGADWGAPAAAQSRCAAPTAACGGKLLRATSAPP